MPNSDDKPQRGDDCPKCDYGQIHTRVETVGVSKDVKQRIVYCGNQSCTYRRVE